MLLPLALTFITGALAVPTQEYTLSGNYTPSFGACPSGHTFVRPASSGLAAGEVSWLQKRQPQVLTALKEYICRTNISGFDSEAFFTQLWANQSQTPVIAAAISGGGNHAEFAGFGLYQALDGRYAPSVEAGTGGIAQALTYFSGLSGGSFTTVALAISEFADLQSLIDNNSFNLTINFTAFNEFVGKAELGYPLTIGDLFGMASSRNVLSPPRNPSVNPAAWTWSGIQAQEAFSNGSIPMSMLMGSEVIPEGVEGSNPYVSPYNGTILTPAVNASTFYEFTPFEFGSYTGRIKAYSDMQYYGTYMSGGMPVSQKQCITGYDTACYLSGTVSTAINLWLSQAVSNGTVGQFGRRDNIPPPTRVKRQNPYSTFIPYPTNEAVIAETRIIDGTIGQVYALPDYAEALQAKNVSDILYAKSPNPFFNYTNGVTAAAAGQSELYIVDGSETGQNNPVWPLLRPERNVDLIIMSDASGTELSTGWMNGTSLHNTYVAAQANGVPFPKIPSVNTILNLGYTSKPTFFGCNEPDVPLVLYVADYPYTSYTNISLTIASITPAQVRNITGNGVALFSQDGGNLAPNWPTCVACGTIWRSLEKMQWTVPDVCKQCMKDYCWQGNVNDASPSFLAPSPVLIPGLTWAAWNATVFGS